MCLAENPSHELHFFLAVNDNAIFKQAVQPLLESKHPMERSFMDDWLAVCPTTLKTLKV